MVTADELEAAIAKADREGALPNPGVPKAMSHPHPPSHAFRRDDMGWIPRRGPFEGMIHFEYFVVMLVVLIGGVIAIAIGLSRSEDHPYYERRNIDGVECIVGNGGELDCQWDQVH